MDWRLKFLITWLVLTILFRVCTFIAYNFTDHHYNWNFFKKENGWAIAWQFVMYGGLVCIGGYGLFNLGNWWVNF